MNQSSSEIMKFEFVFMASGDVMQMKFLTLNIYIYIYIYTYFSSQSLYHHIMKTNFDRCDVFQGRSSQLSAHKWVSTPSQAVQHNDEEICTIMYNALNRFPRSTDKQYCIKILYMDALCICFIQADLNCYELTD